MNRSQHISAFVETIWEWYAENKRVLPWRDLLIKDGAQRAYQIWVSEVMLQQTQVSRVKIVYKNFLEQFPTIEHLAAATNAEVILAWRGMGYNSRALRLRDGARVIVTSYKLQVTGSKPVTSNWKTSFPREMKDLLAVPGIGPYTAAAIRNFAFNIPTPCLDTNIRRILHRVFVGAEKSDGTWKKDDEYLLRIADQILHLAVEPITDYSLRIANSQSVISNPSKRLRTSQQSVIRRTAAEWHAALMDYGSLVCTKNNPKWDICPLTKKGLMEAAYKVKIDPKKRLASRRAEPGREMAGRFIPNRIFRGRVVEELRDEAAGLPLAEIGRRICLDWEPEEHREWLQSIIQSLMRDSMLEKRGKAFGLKK